MNDFLAELKAKACFLRITIPYPLIEEIEWRGYIMPPMLDEKNQYLLDEESRILDMVVNLKTHQVEDWEGYMLLWGKVYDSGVYTLLDADKQPIWQIDGYVPNRLVPPSEKGFRDYIELEVNPDGTITGWPEVPDFSEFVENGEAPQPLKTNKWGRSKEALWRVRLMELNKKETKWLITTLKTQYMNNYLDLSELVKNGKASQPLKTNKWHRIKEAFYRVQFYKLNKEEIEWLINRLSSNCL